MACCQKRKSPGSYSGKSRRYGLDDTDEASKERSREEFRGSHDADEASREYSREEFQGRWLDLRRYQSDPGIGRPSAVKLAQREDGSASRNDRTARILVPVEWLKPAKKEASREELPCCRTPWSFCGISSARLIVARKRLRGSVESRQFRRTSEYEPGLLTH